MIDGTVHHSTLDQEDTRCASWYMLMEGVMVLVLIIMSVFVTLMRGEHDDKLTWPFRGDITIQLVNQNRAQNHFESIVHVTNENGAADNEKPGRVISRERARYSWGYSTFISHAKLESTARTKQYLKNNRLKFRVNKVVIRSV